jgi:hypothetical protein
MEGTGCGRRQGDVFQVSLDLNAHDRNMAAKREFSTAA